MVGSLDVAIVLYVLKWLHRTRYLLSTAVSHRSSLNFASVAHNRRRRTLAATPRRAVALHGLAPQASTSALGAAGVLDVPQESAAGRRAATWRSASHDGENSSVSKHRVDLA